jgi:hypothetical protein
MSGVTVTCIDCGEPERIPESRVPDAGADFYICDDCQVDRSLAVGTGVPDAG